MKVLAKYGFAGYVGKVNMDRNSSPGLLETTRETIAQTRLWLEETKNGIGAIYPILTPRYFPSCTESCLQQLGQLAEEYHVPVQSHLSEGLDEIDWVRELAPDLDFYAQAYCRVPGHERAHRHRQQFLKVLCNDRLAHRLCRGPGGDR